MNIHEASLESTPKLLKIVVLVIICKYEKPVPHKELVVIFSWSWRTVIFCEKNLHAYLLFYSIRWLLLSRTPSCYNGQSFKNEINIFVFVSWNI
jgi:hypothetical protein